MLWKRLNHYGKFSVFCISCLVLVLCVVCWVCKKAKNVVFNAMRMLISLLVIKSYIIFRIRCFDLSWSYLIIQAKVAEKHLKTRHLAICMSFWRIPNHCGNRLFSGKIVRHHFCIYSVVRATRTEKCQSSCWGCWYHCWRSNCTFFFTIWYFYSCWWYLIF